MVGIDLVEHKRIEARLIELSKKILSESELIVFNRFNSTKRKVEYVASRFAAKEALYKVYKGEDKLGFKDVSILNKEDGSPYIYSERLLDKYDISISHENNYSVAIVIKIN